jgi:hypothetical protein
MERRESKWELMKIIGGRNNLRGFDDDGSRLSNEG